MLAQLAEARQKGNDDLFKELTGIWDAIHERRCDAVRSHPDLLMDRQPQCCIWSKKTHALSRMIEELTREQLLDLPDISAKASDSDSKFLRDALEQGGMHRHAASDACTAGLLLPVLPKQFLS